MRLSHWTLSAHDRTTARSMSVRIVSSDSYCPLPNQGALTRTEHGHGHGHGGHLALSIESVRAPKASTESTGTLVHCFKLGRGCLRSTATRSTLTRTHTLPVCQRAVYCMLLCARFLCTCAYVCMCVCWICCSPLSLFCCCHGDSRTPNGPAVRFRILLNRPASRVLIHFFATDRDRRCAPR